tara:strand:- start:289 stop:501 length:213 start_codon:yes stop_codon:yes gene_type:complete
MIKIIFLLSLFFLLNNCSQDYKKVFLKKNEQSDNNDKISDLNFDYSLTFDQFKKNVITYGKLSNYPDLNN